MKNLILISALFTFIGLFSCNQPTNEEKTEDVAEDINKEKFSGAAQRDVEFVVEAYSYNLMLIEYAEAVANKGDVLPVIQDYANNALRYHGELNKTLKELATAHHITLPESVGENVVDYKEKLLEKEGNEFSEDYISTVAEIQENMISKYKAASETSMDEDVLNFAKKYLPGLQERQAALEKIEEVTENIDEKAK